MKNFVFVHNPKTAGTAMTKVLGETINHRVAYHRERPAGIFTFCFVRNTWDRLVSWFLWHQSRAHKMYTALTFEEWVHKGCPNDYGLIKTGNGWGRDYFGDQLVNSDGRAEGFPGDPLRQLDYVLSPSGELIVHFVGRYERLQADFYHVCDCIGCARAELAHINVSERAHYTTYYTPETRDIVAELYRDDIKYFHFGFGTSTCPEKPDDDEVID